MASLGTQSNGLRIVQFMAPSGRRCSIRLGRIPLRDAESFKLKIERLVASKISGQAIDNDVAVWLSGLPTKYHDKLLRFGLVGHRDVVDVPTIEQFLKTYIDERTDVKPATVEMFRHAERNLLGFFNPQTRLDQITEDDADRFNRYLRGKSYARASVSKWIKITKQFFRTAVRKQLIQSNPFEDLSAGPQNNPSRAYDVKREYITKVLEQCPDDQWKLIVLLSRYGGLRCPSEVLRLKWEDVRWTEGKIIVHASKTEHQGNSVRVVPLFPEIVDTLSSVHQESAESTNHVISRYRGGNLRTRLVRMIKDAGLSPWPRVFHNMRATRQTELEDRFPSHVVCAWMGNSIRVAREHYLQVSDQHYENALQRCNNDAVPV